MTPRITLATALRVLTQLRRDPRTIALLLVVPPALLTLLRYVLGESGDEFDRLGAPMVGLFPFITMFLVTSITMLRERTTGTLERLMSMPISFITAMASGRTWLASVPALNAAKRAPPQARTMPSAIWLRMALA